MLDNTNLIGTDLLITLQEKVLLQMVWEESEMGHILNMGQWKIIQIKVDQLTSEQLPNAHSATDQKQIILKHFSPFFSLTLSPLGLPVRDWLCHCYPCYTEKGFPITVKAWWGVCSLFFLNWSSFSTCVPLNSHITSNSPLCVFNTF